MKIRKVIAVYKRGSAMADRTAHTRSLRQVEEILSREGIGSHFVHRTQAFEESGADLILTIGGDGTFLDASHRVVRRPILGLNSSPRDSVGVFCGTTADTFAETLQAIRSDRATAVDTIRLRIRLRGERLSLLVLNEVLVANSNPAGTSRYVLQWKGRDQVQKSSGIWIATPAGSTAAISGAGGKFLSVRARKFQFLVRELYQPLERSVRMDHGMLSCTEKLTVISRMQGGGVYVDGPHFRYAFRSGDEMEVSADAPPLRILEFNEKRRRNLWL